MSSHFGPIIPTLKVTSMRNSIDFYTETLGFTLKWSWTEAEQFQAIGDPDFACLECGQAVLFLSKNDGGTACAIFIEMPFIEDVEELSEAIDKSGNLPTRPQEMPWGSLEFILPDPDGHKIRFSCPSNRTKQTE